MKVTKLLQMNIPVQYSSIKLLSECALVNKT